MGKPTTVADLAGHPTGKRMHTQYQPPSDQALLDRRDALIAERDNAELLRRRDELATNRRMLETRDKLMAMWHLMKPSGAVGPVSGQPQGIRMHQQPPLVHRPLNLTPTALPAPIDRYPLVADPVQPGTLPPPPGSPGSGVYMMQPATPKAPAAPVARGNRDWNQG